MNPFCQDMSRGKPVTESMLIRSESPCVSRYQEGFLCEHNIREILLAKPLASIYYNSLLMESLTPCRIQKNKGIKRFS